MRPRLPCLVLRFQPNFKEFWPIFPGKEEAIVRGIVGDAVHDIEVRAEVGGLEHTGEVDDANDFARGGINPHDIIGLPDVGEDLAFDVLQLVEVSDGLAIESDGDGAFDVEGGGIEKAESVGAVAEDKRLAVGGEAPTFAVVSEL